MIAAAVIEVSEAWDAAYHELTANYVSDEGYAACERMTKAVSALVNEPLIAAQVREAVTPASESGS